MQPLPKICLLNKLRCLICSQNRENVRQILFDIIIKKQTQGHGYLVCEQPEASFGCTTQQAPYRSGASLCISGVRDEHTHTHNVCTCTILIYHRKCRIELHGIQCAVCFRRPISPIHSANTLPVLAHAHSSIRYRY